VVRGGTTLGEGVCRITGKVWQPGIFLKELLHWRKDQGLRNLEAGCANGLVLPLLRIYRQRVARRIAAASIPHRRTSDGPGGVRVINITAEGSVGEITGNLSGRWDIRQSQRCLVIAPAIIAGGKERLVLKNWSTQDRAKLILAKW